ncbi:MAG: DUF58 domain-containing protein [Oscillospiraceae bacterium]|nr:DUF58 domain-containing protein [Oscillospiraceae bacterium]
MSRKKTSRIQRKEKRRQRRPIRIRRLLALLAVIGAAVLIVFRGGPASYLLFWATLIPPLYALIWRLTAGRRFSAVMRTDASTALRGERLGCTLRLVNNSILPVPAVSYRMSGGRLRYDETEEQRVSLAPGEALDIRFTPRCLHCGKAETGAAEIRLRDPFALTEKRLSALAAVHVEPRQLRLPRLIVAPAEEREHRSGPRVFLGERTPSGELRAYQPGDDVRRVNWKVSALQGRPIIRDTEPDTRNEMVLIPDLRDALPADEMEEYLAQDSVREGTLALADWFLRLGIPMRVLPDEDREVSVRTGEDLQKLRALMNGDCFTGSRRTDEMLETDIAAGRPVRRYILLTWEADEALLRRVARCIGLGAEITLISIGGGKDLRSQAETVQRLEFRQVNARRDILAVLSGGEGGAL